MVVHDWRFRYEWQTRNYHVGLSPETAHLALNEAVKLLRAGVDLIQVRHRDLIGKVDCEFRPVDRKWVEQLTNWALGYYDGADFPVLQAVYPDLNNRFKRLSSR
jgi:hypothetical protein